jgi:NAD(P)H-hydrate repair Nnr-like enzyme with NAD(P)H-hydrate dehydratase domain
MTIESAGWTAAEAARWIAVPTEADDKYSRGVVGFATGSVRYPGAAVTGIDAAVHAGIGMVRYAGPASVGALVLQRRPEVVLGAGRVGAWVVGSGMDGAADLAELPPLPDDVTLVIDAGAIGNVLPRGPSIATPHAGELARLLGIERAEVLADPIATALAGADELGAVVLLKGATTFVVGAGRVIAVREATPWLATAGAGDSLAGILGALVAAHAAGGPLDADKLVSLGATAALLHGRAARLAAETAPDGSGGGPFSILDLNARMPQAIRSVLAAS